MRNPVFVKLSVLVGTVLLIGGAFFLFSGEGFSTKRDVLEVGGMTVSTVEKHPLNPWVATVALLIGLGLVTEGLRRKA
jgi:hypothetical protein